MGVYNSPESKEPDICFYYKRSTYDALKKKKSINYDYFCIFDINCKELVDEIKKIGNFNFVCLYC